ncbi:MAG: nucleotidyltransferase domain-containing protein [bacterium]|nr:nucleotidyltransferase domain-containing protein [bacterium]
MDTIRAGKEIAAFIRELRRQFSPEQIILFGSRARGDHWKPSDYDFIIVSSRFAGIHWHDRMVRILNLWNLPEGLDVLPYTPQEFADKRENSSTVRSAVREGKLIEL